MTMLSRTARQQGWLGKAAAGLRAVQGAAARPGEPQAPWTAAGVLPLSGGRLPAAFWRQASCRFLEAGFLPGHWLNVAQCRTAIALAELFGVIILSRAMRQQGWLGKAAAGLRAVQGAAAHWADVRNILRHAHFSRVHLLVNSEIAICSGNVFVMEACDRLQPRRRDCPLQWSSAAPLPI